MAHLRHHAFMLIQRIQPLGVDRPEAEYVQREVIALHTRAVTHVLLAPSVFDLLGRQLTAQAWYFELGDRLIATILQTRNRPLEGPQRPDRQSDGDDSSDERVGEFRSEERSLTFGNM